MRKKTRRSRSTRPAPKLLNAASQPDPVVPIVGIGASAGGLEALELFLRAVPQPCGMAFAIVLHLDPTQKGMMPDLLQRVTTLKVIQAKDQMRVVPECVYVIPPNRDMSISHGVLHLQAPVAPRGLRLPIDFFFRSLAADQEGRGIVVVLSGMGTDGTLGIRAIKENAGVVFVQQPESAKFDGMPRSAIETGLADVVAPAGELPGRIRSYLQHVPLVTLEPKLAEQDRSRSGIEKILILLQAQTGHDFSLYKKNTLYRRIERRMGLHQIEGIAGYSRFLQENPSEIELLFKDLLIGVTSFFRDPASWERLKGAITPAFLATRSPNQPLRAWVPACATGEEAYSLAIAFQEAVERVKAPRKPTLQIFATDLDGAAIEKARAGVFPANVAADVTPERLSRFFVQVDGGYQIGKAIRQSVIFAVQNISMDPPFTRLDILSCRNLLIYLTPELQKKLLPLFHYSLNPGGLLLLGSAESVGARGDLFALLDEKARLYRRQDRVQPRDPVEFPAAFFASARMSDSAPRVKMEPGLPLLAERLLIERYAPAAILVNGKGDILYVSGRTGKYLEPAAGTADWSLFAMARDGLRSVLTKAFPKALQKDGPIACSNLIVETAAGPQAVDVEIQAIQHPEALRGLVLVTFTDAAAPAPISRSFKGDKARAGSRLVELERRLAQSQRELQAAREEMQHSFEEFKSTNEELQSTNEELQSTNEELTTSREEMQSMNEELQTLNHELQAKMDDLSRTNNDVRNLLETTENAVLFLDASLRLRLFTAGAKRFFRLIPADVGRALTDITNDLNLPDLDAHVRQVLQTLAFYEQDVATRNGRWVALRIVPYRTLDNVIDGVVLTLVDITAAKELEVQLRRAEGELQQRTPRRES